VANVTEPHANHRNSHRSQIGDVPDTGCRAAAL
jgi:hypothetical protein